MERQNNSVYFSFEDNFDDEKQTRHFVNNWKDSCWYSLVYILLMFGGKRWMRNRDKFSLQPMLIAWNCAIGIFSAVSCWRLFSELLANLTVLGPRDSFCSFHLAKGALGFWSYAYAVSKLFEFLDTFFIVLRKQKLIFLHWYHHCLTCVFTWRLYSDRSGFAPYLMWMNMFVHSIMYPYYALKAMRFAVPRCISMMITTLQISQMLLGIATLYIGHKGFQNNYHCSIRLTDTIFGLIMYTSYFVLFGYFFYNSYMSKSGKSHLKHH